MTKDHSLIDVGYKPIPPNVKPLEVRYNNSEAWLVRGTSYIGAIKLLSTQEAINLISAQVDSGQE